MTPEQQQMIERLERLQAAVIKNGRLVITRDDRLGIETGAITTIVLDGDRHFNYFVALYESLPTLLPLIREQQGEIEGLKEQLESEVEAAIERITGLEVCAEQYDAEIESLTTERDTAIAACVGVESAAESIKAERDSLIERIEAAKKRDQGP